MRKQTSIKVDKLGKKYRIGESKKRHDTLRDSISENFNQIFKKFRRPRKSGDSDKAASNEIWALNDVSFEIKQGEIVGIIGRNGAGKSTLLKTLARITEPTHGSIDIYGRVGSLLEVGTGFHPELSGRENIYLNGSILGMKKFEIERQLDAIVDFAEVEQFIDTPVKHYSSGMYLRLAFSVAAHLQPEILLVDEVLAVGDAVFQKKCLGKMDDVAKQGRTVLFVSHNMSAIQDLCQRGILIENGKVGYDGRAGECIGEYYKRLHNWEFDTAKAVPHDKSFRVSPLKINDTLTPEIENGSDFEVTFDITGKGTGNLRIIFIVESISGQQIVHNNISSKELGIDTINNTYSVKINVPKLWLTPGIYSVYLKFLTPAQVSDWRVFSERVLLEVKGGLDNTGKTILSPQLDWEIVKQQANVQITI